METTIEYKGHEINIEQDLNPQNPLTEWDNLGTITYNPNARTILGSVGMAGQDVDRIAKSNKYVSIPVFAYVHSGATVKAAESNPFSCPWDSGQSGIIYASKRKIRKEFGWKNITKAREEQIKGYLKSEVETFDNYLTGEVYGYTIDEDGDSCWGFYGDNFENNGLLEYAKNAIDHIIKNELLINSTKDNV